MRLRYRQESGHNPLAVNVAGKSYYPATREEAERLIREALAAGKPFDVGIFQINSWWMERFAIDPFSLLDPDVNEAWGKRILAEEIKQYINYYARAMYEAVLNNTCYTSHPMVLFQSRLPLHQKSS